MLDGNTVSFCSRKQSVNAQSTAEAEYILMNEGVRDVQWMRSLLTELR